MCGGFAGACAAGGSDRAWHLGRLITYASLGAMAGGAGLLIPGPGWVAPLISAIGIVWFSLALAGIAPEPRFTIPGISRLATRLASKDGWAGRVLFGMATSLLPCGLVYAALAIPMASGSALVGALSMLAFGLGTTPALLVVTRSARRLVVRDLRLRRALAAAVLVAGLTAIGLRYGLTPEHAGAHSAHGSAPPGDDVAVTSLAG